MNRRIFCTAALSISALLASASSSADNRFITVVSTTSTENSGLFARILPIFEARTGIEVRVVAVGTGQALRIARNGDADVLLVHHKPSEEQFVADGFGVERHDVMFNDFILIGPGSDPAGVAQATEVVDALARIASHGSAFVSRGDDSGTHKREIALWRSAGVDAASASGTWYQELGNGMGATLNTAAAKNAYTLCDRGTWLSFQRRKELKILSEGDQKLMNPYGVILINPKRFVHVKALEGQMFIDWLISSEGQQAIEDYKIGGEQLFFPGATRGAAHSSQSG